MGEIMVGSGYLGTWSRVLLIFIHWSGVLECGTDATIVPNGADYTLH